MFNFCFPFSVVRHTKTTRVLDVFGKHHKKQCVDAANSSTNSIAVGDPQTTATGAFDLLREQLTAPAAADVKAKPSTSNETGKANRQVDTCFLFLSFCRRCFYSIPPWANVAYFSVPSGER